MRPVRALLLFTLLVGLGAGLLAPWAWWLAQWLAQTFPGSSLCAGLAGFPFDKFVQRLLLALALAGSWPLVRSLGARSAAELGLVEPSGQGPKLAAGFALGVGTLACAAALVLLGGGRKFRADLTVLSFCQSVLSAGLAAAAIALRKAHCWPAALLASSVIYSLLYFFQRPAPPTEVHWFSGLAALPPMLAGLVHTHTLLPEFLTLLLSGIFLGLAYQRVGNLYFSIGLHAGWVFWAKLCALVTLRRRAGGEERLWGSRKLTDSWLALLLLPRLIRGLKPAPASHAI
ncbi:MAG: hypothetical protein EXS38_10425 [Opitutus sp.]|nr:hypothetical protein [Opitutus sp.]